MKRKTFKILTFAVCIFSFLTACAQTQKSSENLSTNSLSSFDSQSTSEYKKPSIQFVHKEVSMYEGDTFAIQLLCENINGTIFYQSSDEQIAVIENETIVAKKEGNVVITATADEVIATCSVKIIKATTVLFDHSELTVYLKKTIQLHPSYYFKGELIENKVFSFASSDETIASVDQEGYVTGKKVGSVSILARCENFEATITIQVAELISLVLSEDEIELQPNDQNSIKLTASVKRNGVNVKAAQVNWSVMDEGVLSLSPTNNEVLVIAKKCGVTAIVAEYKGEVATCIVSSYKTIRTVEDMEAIKLDKDGWYKVMNNIDFAGAFWQAITPWAGDMVPLSNYFGGIFDGQGYTISNITFSAGWHSGLFGEINENAIIKNVSIVNSVHQSTSNKTGSICALNHGRIENVYTESTINADSQSMWNSSGGLVATNYPNAIVRNCITKIKATKTYKNVGALIGYNCGLVENTYAIIEGNASFPFIYEYSNDLGTIANSYCVSNEEALYDDKLYYDYDKNIWTVTGYALPVLKNFGQVNFNATDTYLTLNKTYKINPSNVLGLKQKWEYTGDVDSFDLYYDQDGTLNVIPIQLGEMNVKVTLENGSFATTKFIAKEVVLVPNKKDVQLDYNNPKYASTNQISLKDEDGNDIACEEVTFVSSDEEIATIDEKGLITAQSGGKASISLIYESSTYVDLINVSITPWLQIATVDDFNRIRNNLTANYCLVNDIDYQGNTYETIGKYDGTESKLVHFSGVLDGNGHTISNLVIPSTGDTSGIFGVVLETSVIRNINFVQITGNLSRTTSAGIVGFNMGLIENVYVEYIAMSGGPTAIKGAGVITGTNEFRGTVRNCLTIVRVDEMPDDNYFGSLVGLNQGLLENSFSMVYGAAKNKVSAISFDNGATRTTTQYVGNSKEEVVAEAISKEYPYGSFSSSDWQIVAGQLPKLVVIVG